MICRCVPSRIGLSDRGAVRRFAGGPVEGGYRATLLRMSDAGGHGLESPNPGPLFAEFSIRKFVAAGRDDQAHPCLSLGYAKGRLGLGNSKSPGATTSYTFSFT